VRYDDAGRQSWMALDADGPSWAPAAADAAAPTDAWLTRASDFRWRFDPAGRFSAEVRRLGPSDGEEQWVPTELSQGGFDHDVCHQILGVGAVPFVLTSLGVVDPAALRSRTLVATGLEDQMAKGPLIARSDRSEQPFLLSPAAQSLVRWDGPSGLFGAGEWPTDPGVLVSVLVDQAGWRLFRDHVDGLHLQWVPSKIAVGPGRVFLDGQFSFDRVFDVLGDGADLQVWTGSRVEVYRGSATVPVAVIDHPLLEGAPAFGWSDGQRTMELGGRRFVAVDGGFVEDPAESPDHVISTVRHDVGTSGLNAVLKAQDAVLELELPGSGREHSVADVLGVARSGNRLWLAGRDGVRWLRLEPRWLDRLGSASR